MILTLTTLLSSATEVRLGCGNLDRSVAGIAVDSRQVEPESLFVAVPGVHDDGHRHIDEALRRGAGAVLVQADRSSTWVERLSGSGATVLVAPSSRRALSRLASAFHGDPTRHLQVMGVTGTNGKTTTTYLLRSFLEAAGRPTGLIGTVGYQVGKVEEPSANTTPGPLQLHRLFARMREEGLSHVAMEVSSHALDQGRVDDVTFRVAVFTNLTQDHLDYHRTIEAYFAAKARLFRLLEASRGCAVVNIDDPYGRRLRRMIESRVITYGLEGPADCTAREVVYTMEGTACRLVTPLGEVVERMPLVGRHNLCNLLASAAAALECGVPLAAVGKALAGFDGVPGRLERVQVPAPYGVFVDYAHTPDGVRNLLGALRALPHRRLIVVFGCGGDRDRQKRPQMGAVATELADVVILTTDNPRSERPEEILQEIQAGVHPGHRCCYTVADRAEAIRTALTIAQADDVVVIAGKGHERYQIIGREAIPFDDRQVVREVLTCSPLPISL